MNDKDLCLKSGGNAAVIVARPGDETLWAAGLICQYPQVDWTLACLSGGQDPDRVRRFKEAAAGYGAVGAIGKLFDDRDERPMPSVRVERAIMELLPADRFDVLVTHALWGEYTRDLRSEEVGNAMQILHGNQRLLTPQLLCFAYEDQDGQTTPQADTDADIQIPLTETLWRSKANILEKIYGLSKKDWRVRHVPRHEAFWSYRRFGA